MLKELFPGSTNFAVAIFKILQISKYFSVMLHECSSSFFYTLEKNFEFELWFIVLCPKTITQNMENASFTELLKSLLTIWVLKETRQTWAMFSELKALVDSEKS